MVSSFTLAKRSWDLMMNNKKLILLHGLVFAILYGLLVRGLGQNLGLQDLKTSFTDGFSGAYKELIGSFSLLGVLFTTANTTSTEVASVYQVFLFMIMSLSTLWLVRNIRGGEPEIKVRDAYYQGPAQIVPYLIVLLFLGLQLMPMVVGNSVASAANANDLLNSSVERAFVITIVGLLSLLSLYLVTGSIFGLVIVSLTGTRPWESIRASNHLVIHRRWAAVRRVLMLLIFLTVGIAVVMIPALVLVTAVAEYIFYALSVLAFIFLHVYIYELYRELIK